MAKNRPLKINKDDGSREISEFESHPAHNRKGLIFRPFRFLKNFTDQNPDQLASRAKPYKAIKLYKGTREWWVQYWYRIPVDLQHLHPGKFWQKFRVWEDINREKTEDYAKLLLESVEFALKNGFDPFQYSRAIQQEIAQEISPKKNWTITQGLSLFLQKWKERGNDEDTLRFYELAVGYLQQWLTVRKLQNRPLNDLSEEWIEGCLQEKQKEKNWSNRTYNNNRNLLSTCMNYLVRKKLLADNPTREVTVKKAISEKHKYYDPEKFEILQKVLPHDPTVHFAARLVYYLRIRSNQEMRNLKIGDLYPDRKQVYVRGESAKTDKGRFISIPDDELLEELKSLRKSFPADYYVFGAWPNKGNKKQLGLKPGPKAFGKNFLAKRFAQLRHEAGFSDAYTLYGLAHTRVIHLKMDGANDADIMAFTGHDTFESYSKYLRDLGVAGNPEAINQRTRKF